VTRTTNARIAGVAYLLYIAAGYPSMLLSDRATSGADMAAKLAWLLLRGRLVPVSLAALGVIASAVIAIGLPLQVMEVLPGLVTRLMWLPILVFELVLAVWLIVKGVATPEAR